MYLLSGCLIAPMVAAPSDPAAVSMTRQLGGYHGEGVDAVIRAGRPALPGLRAVIRDPRSHRLAVPGAVYAVGQIPGDRTEFVGILLYRLTDAHESTRCAVIETLTSIPEWRNLTPMITLLADDGVLVHNAAVRTLATRGTSAEAIAISAWMKTPAFPRHLDYFRERVEDLEAYLQKLPPLPKEEKARPARAEFKNLLSDQTGQRLSAVRRLAELAGPSDLSPVAAMLFDREVDVRKAAADALAQAGDLSALKAIDCWIRGPAWQWYPEDVRPHYRAARDRLAYRLSQIPAVQLAPPPRRVGR